ncbi:MAG: DUF2326 domain-containing protein [Propionibacteriaceae bacterium]|jgi:uncharacterized protein YydD (DUF2326 family)|nr:DUF2326 domain-containing protein [Propionibacteriaceae bacterium]
MFLREIGASDARFKKLVFHDGMNLLLADKTAGSTTGDSRNGVGKTSFVRILRYLLGGSLDRSLKPAELADHVFYADLALGAGSFVRVERQMSPTAKLAVDGKPVSPAEWKTELESLFGLSEAARRPTLGELIGQVVRYYFDDAMRTHANESNLDCGIRVGYLLGLSPEILGQAVEVDALEKHRTALNKAIKAGALPTLSSSEAELRAHLASVRDRRSRLELHLKGFRVDGQYAEHQSEADRLSARLRDLNDQGLVLRQRKRELEEATEEEQLPTLPVADLNRQLRAMYEEVGLVLPDVVARRFDEVFDFHASVVRNRKLFLRSELQAVNEQLRVIAAETTTASANRAVVMDLLQQSMALETFRSAERDLTELDATVTDLERRLEQVQALAQDGLHLQAMAIQAETGLRAEYAERAATLDEAMAMFTRLGQEIYSDRSVSFLIEATKKGVLKVEPKIDGDASSGISEVKTFLLDVVCLITAIKADRAPRLLVHDSLLFDSMDDRQMASCLNIGARLAEEHGFQYIVTTNSDRLEAAEREGFERRDRVIDPVLTDKGETGGLFGFRFV